MKKLIINPNKRECQNKANLKEQKNNKTIISDSNI